MKKLIPLLFLALVGFQSAHAGSRTLECTSGNAFERFTATMDYSAFDAGSGFFRLTNATVTDNYANAQLICTGFRMEEVGCIGFWFENSNSIVKVSLERTGDGFRAIRKELEGHIISHNTEWPCTVR